MGKGVQMLLTEREHVPLLYAVYDSNNDYAVITHKGFYIGSLIY